MVTSTCCSSGQSDGGQRENRNSQQPPSQGPLFTWRIVWNVYHRSSGQTTRLNGVVGNLFVSSYLPCLFHETWLHSKRKTNTSTAHEYSPSSEECRVSGVRLRRLRVCVQLLAFIGRLEALRTSLLAKDKPTLTSVGLGQTSAQCLRFTMAASRRRVGDKYIISLHELWKVWCNESDL